MNKTNFDLMRSGSYLFFIRCLSIYLIVFHVQLTYSQSNNLKVNYDESNIPPYVLPDLTAALNGKEITTIQEWEEIRRPEILQLFKDEVYGQIPEGKKLSIRYQVIEDGLALNGNARRKQVQIHIGSLSDTLIVNLLMYLPVSEENSPIIFGYNFYGNQSIILDTNIILSNSWVRNNPTFEIIENKQTNASRGKRSYRWAVEMIIKNGFGLATAYYGDIDPDRNDFSDGIHPFYYSNDQNIPSKTEWGAIGAWAWGASRILDYLKVNPGTQHSKVIIFGHSRLGKTALWAAAMDIRFDMVIANNSGCGGAALFRRKIGETAEIINNKFPHWFSDSFLTYNGAEHKLPIDQHMLIALIAPRPVYIASAKEDRWADPKGEYLSTYQAGKVYQLYGKPVLTDSIPPPTHQPLHSTIQGYHIREGKHDVTDYDWEQFLNFATFWLNIE